MPYKPDTGGGGGGGGMGLIPTLLAFKHRGDERQERGILDSAQFILEHANDPQSPSSPESVLWAKNATTSLIGDVLGGGGKGKGGGGGKGKQGNQGGGIAGLIGAMLHHATSPQFAHPEQGQPGASKKDQLAQIRGGRPQHMWLNPAERQKLEADQAEAAAVEKSKIASESRQRRYEADIEFREKTEKKDHATAVKEAKEADDIREGIAGKTDKTSERLVFTGPNGEELVLFRSPETGKLVNLAGRETAVPEGYKLSKEQQDTGELKLREQALRDLKSNDPIKVKAAQDTLKSLAEKEKKQQLSITIAGQTAAANAPGPPLDPNTRGEDVLKGQPENIKRLVRAVSSYKMPLPSGFALRVPPWSTVASLVSNYNPDWAESKYDAGRKMRMDYLDNRPNAPGGQIQSLNKIGNHLSTFEAAVNAMSNGDVQRLNQLLNFFQRETGGSAITNLNEAKTVITAELTTALKSSGATDAEIKAWRDNFNSASSPQQFKDGIRIAYDLIAGRLQPLQEAYKEFMGSVDVPIIMPALKIHLKNHGIDPDTLEQTNGSGTGGSSAPKTADDYLKSIGAVH